jgi:hypothetical protein
VSESLNFHPEVVCGREWTVGTAWYRKLGVAQRALAGDLSDLGPREKERVEKLLHQRSRWLGFKLLFRASDKWLVHPRFSPELWLDQLESFRRWLAHQPEIRIIHIVRCNGLEWLKSRYLARATGFYSSKQYPDGIQLDIPVRSAINRLRAKDWIDGRLATLEASNPYLRIYYEDVEKCEHDVLRSMLQFLQCDTMQLSQAKHGLQKQSNKPAENYLSNYNQLLKELQNQDLLQTLFCKNTTVHCH